MIGRFLIDESGVTAMEYALIGAFILCAIMGTIALIGPQLTVPFQSIATGIAAALANS